MKFKSILLYLFTSITLSQCVALKSLYENFTNENGGTPKNVVFLGALAASQSNCTTPSTTPSIGSGTFSKAQNISFYSSCKFYKTFYEVNGHKSSNSIGSNSIQVPNGDLNPGVVSVVKLKYWSECYRDSGKTGKCSESETPKEAEYIFDTEAPNVELISRNIYYLSNIINNSQATVKFKVSPSGSGTNDKEYSFEIIGENSTVLNSGIASPNTIITFPLYANSLHVGENKLKLNVYDSLKNKSETLITIFRDDTLPNLITNRSSGLYGSSINIEFVSATTESFIGNICYTTDGTEPEMFPFDPETSLTNESICKNGTIFSKKIYIDKNTPLKFIARELSGNMSGVRSLTYTINTDLPTVTILPITNPYIKSSASTDLKFSSNQSGNYHVQTSDGTGENKVDPKTGETKFYFNTKNISSGTILENEEISIPIDGINIYNGQNLIMVSVTVEKDVETTSGSTKEDFTGLAQIDLFVDDLLPISSIQPPQSETFYNTTIIARILSEENVNTYYSINNGAEQIYNPSLGISLSESSSVKYYSIDRAGNKELAKSINYKIDTVPPIVTISDVKPVDKRVSISIPSLSKVIEFGIKSNEHGRFEILKGGCDGTKLMTHTLEGAKVVPEFSAGDLAEGYSSLSICVYDKAGNLTKKSLSNIFRDEKGDFAEVIEGNTNEPFQGFRAWEMPGEKQESAEGNNVLILTQGIIWMFDIRNEIDVPDNCRLEGDPLSMVCDYKKGTVPQELQAQFTVPSDINEIAIANKANYSKIIYLAYPLGLRIEDRANTITNTYLKARLSQLQLNATKVDWVGLSEGTLVNLELINKFKTISDKRIFIAAPFKGSIYRDALAQGVLGDENWALFKDIITKNAPEITQLLESSDYSKTRAPQLLSSLLLAEEKSKSFLIPTNYKNLGIDLVVSIDSQTAGTPSIFDPNNIAVLSGSHFEMGNSPTKDSIRLVVNSILQNGKIPPEINNDLAKNQVPVNYINGKWVAPINGNGGQEGTFTLEPNAGKVEMKILYDNPDWKVDSTIVVDSNTFKNGFIDTSADLNILKKDTGLTITGPATLEIVFDMEKFKKTSNFTNRAEDFKSYPLYFSKNPFTIFVLPTSQLPPTIFGNDTVNRNTPLNIDYFRIGFEDKVSFRINTNLSFHWSSRDVNFYGVRWGGGCALFVCWGPGEIGVYQTIDRTMDMNGHLNFAYIKGLPELNASFSINSWGMLIDLLDFGLWSHKISETDKIVKYKISNKLTDSCLVDIPALITLCNGHQSILFFNFFHTIDLPQPEFTLPILDKNGEPVK